MVWGGGEEMVGGREGSQGEPAAGPWAGPSMGCFRGILVDLVEPVYIVPCRLPHLLKPSTQS